MTGLQGSTPMTVTRAALLTYLEQSPSAQPRGGSAYRVKFLDAAADLLREGGFEAFSMRRVAERLGLTLAALQHHFPTRAALIREVIEHRLAWYGANLADTLKGLPDEPRALFLGVLTWLLDDIRHEPTASFTVQFWAFAAYDPDANATLDDFMARYRRFLALIMRGLNPALGEAESLTRAAMISVLVDGTSLLVAPGKPAHPEYASLQAAILKTALDITLAPPA
jgi:AcrR family transcriptional regulator